jgi:hypothetical protein
LLGDPIHGRAEYGHFGAANCFHQVDRDFVDGSRRLSPAQTGLVTADTQNPFGQSALFDCQADRSADQSDTDNRERFELHGWQGVIFRAMEGLYCRDREVVR